MARLKAANNAITKLTVGITAADTSFTVEDAALFPDAPFRVTIDAEIMQVEVIDKLTNTFSAVQRGLEGTVAAPHNNGAEVANRWTAGYLETLATLEEAQAIAENEAKTHAEAYADDVVAAHKADGTQHAKTARFVIGTSTAGWTAKDCDYLCDGTADQVEINNAIQALPATGGEIVILDGTYNITASIDITKVNISIRGSGDSTILKRMWDGSHASHSIISVKNIDGFILADLCLDGNKSTYSASTNYGLYASVGNPKITVRNVTAVDHSGRGFGGQAEASYLYCRAMNNDGYGIRISSNSVVIGNRCLNNDAGIYLQGSENLVIGNICIDNNTGILSSGATSHRNKISDNYCMRGNGTSSNYTSVQYTIKFGTGNNNQIINNYCLGKEIVIDGGSGNTAYGNKFDSTSDI